MSADISAPNGNKYLLKNFGYLSLIQVANLLIPLIAYPYLIKVLGKEIFGLVIFAQAVASFFMIFVSFGFNISATKEVSVNRNRKDIIAEIVSSVFLIKIVLFLLSVTTLFLGISFFEHAISHRSLFYLSLWICLYDILIPVWYFQGIENMKVLTYLTFITRSIFLSLIFILIKSPEDYLWYPIINGIGTISAGLIALYIIFIKTGIRFNLPKFTVIKFHFVEALPLFLSEASIKIYVSTNKVILGLIGGMADVAYYDLAEKIFHVIKLPQKILSQTLFPKISKELNVNFIKSIIRLSISANIVLLISAIALADYLILLIGGPEMISSAIILKILVIAIPFIAISNVYGIQVLIPFGFKKIFATIVITGAGLYFLILGVLWHLDKVDYINIAILTVIIEIFGASLMYLTVKNKIKFEQN